jgi:hypothetical protein
MKKKNKKVVLGLVGVLILLILFVNLSGLSLPAQSIISVSNISVQGRGEFVQAVIAVNNMYESTFFIPKQYMTSTLDDGSTFQAQKDVEVKFYPEQPTCTVPLRTETKNLFGLFNYTYYVEASEKSKQVPFSYKIFRGGIEAHTGRFNTAETASINHMTSNLGEINITNLGMLDNGPQCPTNSFAIIETDTGLKIVDKAQLESTLNNMTYIDAFACVNVLDLPATLKCVSNWFIVTQGTTAKPSGYIVYENCSPGQTITNGVCENRLTTNNFTYYLRNNSATPLVTVNMNRKFVDGVIFAAPNADIDIVDAWFENVTSLFGQNNKLFVKVKNTGITGDVIRITPTSSGNNSNISPSTVALEVNTNQERTGVFTIFTTNNTNVQECYDIYAYTSGQFGGTKSDTARVCFTIEKNNNVTPTACDNGVCEWWLGENHLTCPEDCEAPVIPEDEDRLNCTSRPTDWWIVGWNYTPPQAFGVIPSKCDPTFNYGLILGGGMLLIIIIVAGFLFMQVKPGKGRRR